MHKTDQTNKHSNRRKTFKKRIKKNFIVLIIFFFFVTLGIGYAYLNSNLTIQGIMGVSKNTWDVHFENIVPDPNNVSATKEATISSDKTRVDFNVALNEPGDEYNFTVDVVNNGTIPAMLNLVELVGITEAQQKYLEYQVLYQDGDPIAKKDALPVGWKETYQVHIKYRNDVIEGDLPTENQTISLSLKSNYVQDDGTGVKRLKEVVLRQSSSSDTNFLKGPLAKDTIETVEFVTYQEVPSDAIASWDVSDKQDGSIMAYYYDQDNDGLNEVYIGCSENSKILANPDSSNLFKGLTNVTSIDLGKLDTFQVTNMIAMFEGCSSLTNLDLSSFDTSQVTKMTSMFQDCSSLTNLNLSSFDTSQVIWMPYMFEDCSSLTSLDLSNFNTSKLTIMAAMFWNCSSLTSIDLSNFDTSQVTNMSVLFSGCSSLTSADLSSFDTSKVTNMGAMFEGCSKLTTTITIRNVNAVDGYSKMFFNAATQAGTQITVNYIENNLTLVDNMIATKSSNSNVVKGNLVS